MNFLISVQKYIGKNINSLLNIIFLTFTKHFTMQCDTRWKKDLVEFFHVTTLRLRSRFFLKLVLRKYYAMRLISELEKYPWRKITIFSGNQ